MRTLLLLTLLILLNITAVAQDNIESQYKVVAQLGSGFIGKAVFSPDNKFLAVPTSQGIELYELGNDLIKREVNATDTDSPFNTPSIFVEFTEDSQSLIYIEPINFKGQLDSDFLQVESLTVWKVNINNFESTKIIAEVTRQPQIEYLHESNQLIFASILFNVDRSVSKIRDYLILDITSGQVEAANINNVQISANSKLRDSGDESNYSVNSSNGIWQYQLHTSSEEYLMTQWYEITNLSNDTIVYDSYNEMLSIKPNMIEMSFSDKGEISIISNPLCGTGFTCKWLEKTTKIISGYGGCGHVYDCLTVIGNQSQYCVYPQWDGNYQTIAAFYDPYYLEQNPDTPNPDFIYEITEHTDSIIYFRVINSKTIVTGSNDNTAIIWDVDTSDQSINMSIRLQLTHPAPVTYVGYNPKNVSEIITASTNHLYFWDSATGELKYSLTEHSYPITSVATSWSNGLIASYSSDSILLVWEATD